MKLYFSLIFILIEFIKKCKSTTGYFNQAIFHIFFNLDLAAHPGRSIFVQLRAQIMLMYYMIWQLILVDPYLYNFGPKSCNTSASSSVIWGKFSYFCLTLTLHEWHANYLSHIPKTLSPLTSLSFNVSSKLAPTLPLISVYSILLLFYYYG